MGGFDAGCKKRAEREKKLCNKFYSFLFWFSFNRYDFLAGEFVQLHLFRPLKKAAPSNFWKLFEP